MRLTLKQMLAGSIVLHVAGFIVLWRISPWLIVAELLMRFGAILGSRFKEIFFAEIKKAAQEQKP